MDIERLNELRKRLEYNSELEDEEIENLWELIDEAIARQSVKNDIGETSDGYHTFNELYEHRTALFATLCNMRSDISWKSMKHDDGTMYDGMFIAGIETPDGQYTYHCEMKYWYMFAMTKEIEKAPSYDGHLPKDYPRLLGLSESSLYRQNRQSVKSEDVSEAISWAQGMEILYEEKQMPECADCAKTAVVALQEYQKPKPDCESAEKCGDKCCGYGKSEYDDEPIDVCKDCEKQVSYGEE